MTNHLLAAISFPILERIPLFGDAAVSPHGLGIAIGFALGAVLMIRRAQKRGLGHLHVPNISDAIQEMLTRSAIGAIVGARGFYVLTHLSDFEGRWHETLYAWQGGLTFLGGVTGAIAFAIPYLRKRGWRLDMLLDSAAPGMALGLAIGRIGDLMIGDHIGSPTDFPLAWRCTANFWVRATNSFGSVDPLPYPGGAAPTAGCYDVAVHHTALYDFGAAVIVLLVLLAMERKRWFDGAFIAAWVFVYGALRFASDFARQDKTWFGLTGSQWALVAAVTAVTAWLVRTKPWRRADWAWDLRFEHPWMDPDFDPDDTGFTQSRHVNVGAAKAMTDSDARPDEPSVDADDPLPHGEPLFHSATAPTVTAPEPAAPVADDDVAPVEDGHVTDEAAAEASAEPSEAAATEASSDVESSPDASSPDEPSPDSPGDPSPDESAGPPTPEEPLAPRPSTWGVGSSTAGRVTRSVESTPKMSSRPRRPRDGSAT